MSDRVVIAGPTEWLGLPSRPGTVARACPRGTRGAACGGEGVPELCERCFPAFDDARLKRRVVATEARGEARDGVA